MITIIVPTMWKHKPFINLLYFITKLDIIKEVIIINNNPTETPDDIVLKHYKIKLLCFGENIYVNPAWNRAIKYSTTEINCLLTDDVTFDLRLFYKVLDFYTPDKGCLGTSAGIVEYGQTPLTTGEIDFEPFIGQACYGFGEIMFVNKSTWVDVPEDIKLYFGDNFVFDQYYFKGYQNYMITNLFRYHEQSLTSNQIQEKNELYEKEKYVYESIKQQLIERKI